MLAKQRMFLYVIAVLHLLTLLCNDGNADGAHHAKGLFDVLADPSEYNDLVNDTSHDAVALELHLKMSAASSGGFRPNRGPQDPQSCITAMERYNGWWGPWVDV